MRARPRVAILLRKAEVDDIHDIVGMPRLGRLGDDKVGGLDVTVNKVTGVDVLDARDLRANDVSSEARKAETDAGSFDDAVREVSTERMGTPPAATVGGPRAR